MRVRLSKDDWIKQGLRTLAADGVSALKVGALSAKLKVSRGSFYWHFRDVSDFRSEILRSWRQRTTEQVIQEIEAEAQPERLMHLMRRAFDVGARRLRWAAHDEWGAERAIRSWATHDAAAAASVAAVDASRVGYITKLLIAAGLETQRAQTRAAFLYWAYLGQTFVMDTSHSSIAITAIDDISDLFER